MGRSIARWVAVVLLVALAIVGGALIVGHQDSGGSAAAGFLTGSIRVGPSGPRRVGGDAPRPAASASVVVESGGRRLEATTRSDGGFAISVPPGRYSIAAYVLARSSPCKRDGFAVVVSRRTTSVVVDCPWQGL